MSDLRKIFLFFTNNKTSESLKKKFWLFLTSPEKELEKEELFEDLWKESVNISDESIEKSLLQVKQKLGHTNPQTKTLPPNIFLNQFFRIASVILFFVSATLLIMHVSNRNENEIEIVEHVVPSGQRDRVELSDGTIVYLNAGSIFLYPKSFSGANRIVYLFGEGNFEVSPDKTKPFIVKTSQVSIQALGTKFNVLSYSDMDNIITTLEEGAIKVRSISDTLNSFILKPDEQISYSYAKQSFELSSVNSDNSSKWIDGLFYFSNQSLKEILNTIRRVYDVNLNIDPQVLSSDLYTFKFEKGESLPKVLRILELTVGDIKVELTPDGKVVKVGPQK